MAKFTVLPFLSVSLIFSSCGYRNNSANHLNERPTIYDAWDARYSYQMESRKMVPLHQGQQVGRTWSRDEAGKINRATYQSSSKESAEDLFVLHAQKLDRQRDKKWENSKEERINFIKSQMEILEEEENAPLIEVPIEDEEEEFFPPAFIPQGIDLESMDTPVEDQDSQDEPAAFPFAPLP